MNENSKLAAVTSIVTAAIAARVTQSHDAGVETENICNLIKEVSMAFEDAASAPFHIED